MAFLISARAGKTKMFLNFRSIGIVTSKTNAPYVISHEISYDVKATYYAKFTLSNPVLKSKVKDLTKSLFKLMGSVSMRPPIEWPKLICFASLSR